MGIRNANHYIELRTTNGGRCSKTTYSILVNGSASEPLIPNKRVRNSSASEPLVDKKPTKTVQPVNSMSSTIEPLNAKNGSTIEHPIIKKEEKNFLKKGCSAENFALQEQPMQLAAQAAPQSIALTTAEPKKPKAEKTEQQQISSQVWEAYSAAYQVRYKAEPIRNAMVNKQISTLVGRLGAEAVQVAAWFVSHSNSYYIQRGHSIGVLLADCEKLRTEWATGRTVSAQTARQLDKTSANAESLAIAQQLIRQRYGKQEDAQ